MDNDPKPLIDAADRPVRSILWLARSEHGVALVILACTLVAMLTIAGLVIDVGFAYATSRQDQNVADFAALAAARHLPGDPSGGCTAGWEYIKANLSDLAATATTPCGSFPSTCDATASLPADYAATGTGDYTITFRYPLPDGDSMLGAARPLDGDNQCERFGVTVTHQDGVVFSTFAGISGFKPSAQAVSREYSGTDLTNVANLVSLDPIGCGPGIKVSGNNTEVLVGSSAYSGAIAIDSDGTACSGQQDTISAADTGAELWATPTSGTDPGKIYLRALPGDATACSVPACSTSDVSGGRVAPQPVSDSERVTRAVVDYAYNCKTSYPEFDGLVSIDGCYNGTPAYIDSLITQVRSYNDSSNTPSLPTGYTLISGNSACSPPSETLTGNYWIDCNTFKLASGVSVSFSGNVIVDGNISLSGGASLSFAGNPSGSMSGCESEVCLSASSSDAAFVYLGGSLSTTSNNYTLSLDHTFMYVTAKGGNGTIQNDPTNYTCASSNSANSVQTQSGGAQVWSAPVDGPFKYLALWSEAGSGSNGANGSTGTNFQLAGGGNSAGVESTIDGVYFTPCSLFKITGGFNNAQTAQFLSFQLAVSGGAVLQMDPDPTMMLKTAPTGAELIR